MLLLQIFQRFPAEIFFAAVCFISNTVRRRNFPKRWSAVCLFPKAPPCQILLQILGYSRGIQISHADNEEENKCYPFEQQGILFFMHMGFLTRYIYIHILWMELLLCEGGYLFHPTPGYILSTIEVCIYIGI
ncbi:unnamed protein product [Camellia sinensis]